MVVKRDRAIRWVGTDLASTAESAVWKALARALRRVNGTSRELLTEFLNGLPPADIAARRNLPVAEVERSIAQAKADLVRELRQSVRGKEEP